MKTIPFLCVTLLIVAAAYLSTHFALALSGSLKDKELHAMESQTRLLEVQKRTRDVTMELERTRSQLSAIKPDGNLDHANMIHKEQLPIIARGIAQEKGILLSNSQVALSEPKTGINLVSLKLDFQTDENGLFDFLKEVQSIDSSVIVKNLRVVDGGMNAKPKQQLRVNLEIVGVSLNAN